MKISKSITKHNNSSTTNEEEREEDQEAAISNRNRTGSNSIEKLRWVHLAALAIVVIIGISFFVENKTIHNYAFQFLLSGGGGKAVALTTSSTTAVADSSRSLEEEDGATTKNVNGKETITSEMIQMLKHRVEMLTRDGQELDEEIQNLHVENQKLASQLMDNQAKANLNNNFQKAPSTTSTTHSISAGEYPAFSCSELLHQLKTPASREQQLDPNRGMINARRTITVPPFYVSIHNKSFDGTRWCIMNTGEYYETKLTAAFQEVLQNSPPGARIIDVGANIGFFSLLSAAGGPFIVDSFEPNLKNRMRFCESLRMNGWFRTEFNNNNNNNNLQPANCLLSNDDGHDDAPIVNLYPYGVGQKEGNFIFREAGNPGQGAVSNRKTSANNTRGVHIITLDSFAQERGWLEKQPYIAILKIDVEGNEYKVIEGAKRLLQTNMIRNIFMEVSIRTKVERRASIRCLEFLQRQEGGRYRLHKVGGWPGPGTKVNWRNNDNVVQKIVDYADREGMKQINLWWKKITGEVERAYQYQ